jgi:hypothetical protein
LVHGRPLLVTGGHTPKLLHPQNTALYHIALGVNGDLEGDGATSRAAFLLARGALIPPLRYLMGNAAPPQQSTALPIAISLIEKQTIRPLPRTTTLSVLSTPSATRHTNRVQDVS